MQLAQLNEIGAVQQQIEHPSLSDSLRPNNFPRDLLTSTPEAILAYILRFCGIRDFFLFGRVAYDARQITHNISSKRMQKVNIFIDRFHDYSQNSDDFAEIRCNHVLVKFYPSATSPNDWNLDELEEKMPLNPTSPARQSRIRFVHSPQHSSSLPALSPSYSLSRALTTPVRVAKRLIFQESPPVLPSFLRYGSSNNETRESLGNQKPKTTSRILFSDGPKNAFHQLKSTVHSMEFEFSDTFWKEIGLGENANFINLLANAKELIIYDGVDPRRAHDFDEAALRWPKCKANKITADGSVLRAYAMKKRHLFPKRVECDTWGDLAHQAEFAADWARQSRELGYETSFKIDLEIPRLMPDGYVQHVSRVFQSEGFPFISRFSTNMCNGQNSTWEGTLVLPPTSHLVLNYEHTVETQQSRRVLDFRQCAFHSLFVEWDIAWCRKARDAKFMISFFEALAAVEWGIPPTVVINVSDGEFKKVRTFLECLVSDLPCMKSLSGSGISSMSFTLPVTLGCMNNYYRAHKIGSIRSLCDEIRVSGVNLSYLAN